MSVQQVNFQQFEEILATSNYILIDFMATWCPPCKMMSPIIDNFSQDPDLKAITFVKVDTDLEPTLAIKFGIMSLPTFVLLKVENETDKPKYTEIARVIGGQEPLSFKTKLMNLTSDTDESN